MDTLLKATVRVRGASREELADLEAETEEVVQNALDVMRKDGQPFHQLAEKVMNAEKARQDSLPSSSSSASRGPSKENTALFEELRFLGRGVEGSVYQVREYTTGKLYARKDIPILHGSVAAARTEAQVCNEMDIMERLRHPHIASGHLLLISAEFCSTIMSPSADSNLRVDLQNCYATGHSGDDMDTFIPLFACLLSALAFAHKMQIMHRDIKPSNILVKDNRVYLADFGEAKDYSDGEMSKTPNYLVCGTPNYRAPESAPGSTRAYPEDLFSLGCVFSEMLTVYCGRSLEDYETYRMVDGSEYPFAFRSNLKMVRRWVQGVEGSEDMLDPLKYLVKRMLNEDPRRRSRAEELGNSLIKDNPEVGFDGGCH